jgi:hypothetical protein
MDGWRQMEEMSFLAKFFSYFPFSNFQNAERGKNKYNDEENMKEKM